ncbi:hypothetical protein F5882DRAFT_312167 [Hyaloscypha sp. PMI_1271]|nr:hypothetical protein F5882DRAFT_312167 [Hyaloscypha sp. PMI_1271]
MNSADQFTAKVKHFTNMVCYYGNTSMSRIEGNHAVLKSYLRNSTGNIKSVFDRFQLHWKKKHKTMEDQLANKRVRSLHSIQHPLWRKSLALFTPSPYPKLSSKKQGLDPKDFPNHTIAVHQKIWASHTGTFCGRGYKAVGWCFFPTSILIGSSIVVTA